MNFRPTILKTTISLTAGIIFALVLFFILSKEYRKIVSTNPYAGIVLSINWALVTIVVIATVFFIYFIWSLIQKKKYRINS